MREGKNGQTLRKEFDVATVTPGLVAWHPARRRIKTVVLKRLLVAAWHYENLEGLWLGVFRGTTFREMRRNARKATNTQLSREDAE